MGLKDDVEKENKEIESTKKGIEAQFEFLLKGKKLNRGRWYEFVSNTWSVDIIV